MCSRLHLVTSPAESEEKKNLYIKFLCQIHHWGNIVVWSFLVMHVTGPFACQYTKLIMHSPLVLYGEGTLWLPAQS